MSTIILFPGLGASERLFEQYHFGERKKFVVKFLVPEKKETLENYCRRLSASIPSDEELFFVGVSFGGILAQEMSKMIPAKKIILISSIKHEGEMPGYFSWAKIFPVYRILPAAFLKRIAVMLGGLFTPKSNEERTFFITMVNEADTRVIRWGIDQTLHWKHHEPLTNIFHIHGDKDRLFPLKKIKVNKVIPGGSHFMIIQRRAEINTIINNVLNNVQ